MSGDRAAKDKAHEKLRMVGLDAYASRMPSELSGGQQQRVAVARALVLEPQVLLFDEPLSNLDAKLRRRVREEIRELQQTLGLTVAYVTHDQQEALAVSDQIIVMSNARIAQIGAPRELYEAPRDRFVADFIGDANLVEAELGPHRGSRAPLRLGGLLELEIEHRGVAPGAVRVAIRPESVILKNGNDSPLRGKVGKAAYLGTHMEYTVATPIGQLFVVDRDVSRPIRAGAEVSDHPRRPRRRARPQLTIHFDPALPINARRDEIRAAVEAHPIVIVCGETGSGQDDAASQDPARHGRHVGASGIPSRGASPRARSPRASPRSSAPSSATASATRCASTSRWASAPRSSS